MSTTVRFARIISIYLLVTGVGFLVSADYYSKMIAHTGSDPVLINLSGMVHFFIGMTVLVYHFQWKNTLQVIVTLFGFLFLMKGVFLIALPELTLQSGNNPIQVPWALSVGFISVGLIVGYMAFLKKGRY